MAVAKQCLKEYSGKTKNIWDALSEAGHPVYDENGSIRPEYEAVRRSGETIAQQLIGAEDQLKDLCAKL